MKQGWAEQLGAALGNAELSDKEKENVAGIKRFVPFRNSVSRRESQLRGARKQTKKGRRNKLPPLFKGDEE